MGRRAYQSCCHLLCEELSVPRAAAAAAAAAAAVPHCTLFHQSSSPAQLLFLMGLNDWRFYTLCFIRSCYSFADVYTFSIKSRSNALPWFYLFNLLYLIDGGMGFHSQAKWSVHSRTCSRKTVIWRDFLSLLM